MPVTGVHNSQRRITRSDKDWRDSLQDLRELKTPRIGWGSSSAKLSPKPEITVSRLAVLALEVAELLQEELDTILDDVKFFNDRKVVLACILNESRWFYVYVHNHVTLLLIRHFHEGHKGSWFLDHWGREIG